MRLMRGRATVAAAAAACVLIGGTPAGAHDSAGPPARNFSTEVGTVDPSFPGVQAGLGPDRERIELSVTTDATVIVLGYRDEPYLRIDPRGVFENRSSPAVRLNRDCVPSPSAHPRSPLSPPRWVRVSSAPTARWHDHRSHWMGGQLPARVRDDPGQTHRIQTWRIPLRIDGQPFALTGTVIWNPAPSPWPWIALAGGVAAVVVLGARSRRAGGAIALALGIGIATEVIHIWAARPFSEGSTMEYLGDVAPSLATVAIACVALAWVTRRTVWSAAPAVLLAGLFLLVTGGLSDLASLSHSVVPSRLDPIGTRVLVALALGLGMGNVISGATLLRAPASRPATGSGATSSGNPARAARR